MFTSTLLMLGLVATSASAAPHITKEVRPIPLTARKVPKGHVAALRKRAGTSVNIPLDDYYNGTDLQYVQFFL